MTNQITIRRAKQEDASEVLALASKNFPQSRIEIKDQDLVLVAQEKGRIIGFIHFCKRKDNLILQAVVVREDFRGRGIGTKLIEMAMQESGIKDKKILLKVESRNIEAINLYQKSGFNLKNFGKNYTLEKKPCN